MSDGIAPAANPITGSGQHSVETAAEDFSRMLADEGKPRRREPETKPATQPPAEADAAETREAGQSRRQPSGERGGGEDGDDRRSERDPILEAEGDEPEAEADAEDDLDAEDPEADDDADAEDGDEPEDPFLDAKHKVKVNGEEVEVSGREALAGYMKEADYRQGAERNAREYAEIEGFAQESVQVRQRTEATLQQALDLIANLEPSAEDWAAMERDNPAAYISAQKHWQGLLANVRQIQTARDQLSADQSAEAKRARNKWIEAQDRELLTKFPVLRDEKKANSFRATVRAYAKSAGFSDEELAEGGLDHRSLITLYKAGMYDRTIESRKAAGKQARGATPKPSAEGRARNPGRNPNRSAGRNADRRLQRTGSVQDAAESFAAMIRSE